MSYYAVKKGHKTGIFDTWKECENQIKGFSGAVFHKFETLEECDEFLNKDSKTIEEIDVANLKFPCFFIDGSINLKTMITSSSVVFYRSKEDYNNEYYMADWRTWDLTDESKKSRNIYAEIQAAILAIEIALRNKESIDNHITIYHDYNGIGYWGNKIWNTNLHFVEEYIKFVEESRNKGLQIDFIHCKGHNNIKGNEIADKIAKYAASRLI